MGFVPTSKLQESQSFRSRIAPNTDIVVGSSSMD